jgi:hypothetical protein
VIDSLVVEVLRRIDPSTDSSRFDTAFARALVENDSLARNYGFPKRCPKGLDTAAILRLAMFLMVDKGEPLARIAPRTDWALGIDTLSVHVRVRLLCKEGLITDTSKIFPHPKVPTDTARKDTVAPKPDTTKREDTLPKPATKDTLPPELRIVAPVAGTVLEYFQDSIDVVVRAIDTSGVDSVTVNHRLAVRRDSFWVVEKVFVPATSSGLVLLVEAWDHARNRSSTSIQVGRKTPPPPKEPYHAILLPVGATVLFDSTSVLARWMVYDPSSRIDSVRIGGVKAVYEKDSIWSARIRLDSIGSPTSIFFAAYRSKGASIVDSVQVTRLRDLVGPAIRFVSPADKQIFEYTTDSVTLSVAVSDPSGIASVKIDGVAGSLSGGQYQHRVGLAMGATAKFSAEARDSAGNLSSASITVTRKAPPDTLASNIQLIWPKSKSGTQVPFDTQFVVLRWVVTDLLGLSDTSVKIAGTVVKGVRDTFSMRVPLPPSSVAQIFHLDVVNVKGVANTDAVSLSRAKDTVRPVSKRRSGSRNVPFDSVAVVVSWQVTDNHKLSSVTINNVAIAGVGDVYQKSVALETGRNQVVLVAKDSTGNQSEDTVEVVRAWKDTTRPVIVRMPGTESRWIDFDSATTNVSWRVTDNSPVKVAIDGVPIAGVDGVYTTAASVTGSVSSVTIVATDTTGNSSADTVIFTKLTDRTPPVLRRTFETRDQSVDYQTREIRVGWRASDNGVLRVVKIMDQVVPAPTDSAYTRVVQLDVGVNVIWILALDEVQNEAHDTIVVVRRNLDTTAPQVIRSNASTQDRVVPMSTIETTLSWKVSDVALSQVKIGDSVIQGDGGVYSKTMALEPGENVIRLVAKDSSGNLTSDSVVINRTDAPAPTRILSESVAPITRPKQSGFGILELLWAREEKVFG